MSGEAVAAVLLAAGHGVRMKSATPKVLHEIGARSMLAHAMAAAQTLTPARLVVVIGDHSPSVGEAARSIRADAQIAVQAPPRGTGDAAAKALQALEGFDGLIVILYADTPLITGDTLSALVASARGRAGAVLGFEAQEAGEYGRLVLDDLGALARIVEAKDASASERAIRLCNSGVMAVEAAFLRAALPRLSPDNAKKEFYLTDIAAMASSEGRGFAVTRGSQEEVLGVNSRIELAAAEAVFQRRRRREAMEGGATLIDPDTVHFSWDTRLGADVIIEPNVFFGPGVEIGDNVIVKASSHLEGARIGAGARVGPFARLRPGADLGPRARVGNFVEVKAATLGEDAKVNHLTYIGDASVGARANIGAGTITCNYDGYDKHRTVIGEGAFVGSNSALVAPVTIGAGAYIGSGSVVTRNVEADALAVARGRQAEIKGWAARFRRAHSDRKE